MPSWQEEYLSALQARDEREKAQEKIFHSYTKLADRTAQLSRAPSQGIRSATGDKGQASVAGGSTQELSQARQDLSEAQRSKIALQAQLDATDKELEKLKLQTRLDNKRISEIETDRATISKKLKDREEEIQGKAKLLQNVHDDNLSLTLQLNLAEEKSSKLQAENKQLVDRWMARMGEEAEAMNDASKFS